MSIYKTALKKKNRVRYFLLWFIPAAILFSLLFYALIGWWSILAGSVVALIANREVFAVALMTQEEVNKELEPIK